MKETVEPDRGIAVHPDRQGEPLVGLNPAQREAVLHFEGPMLVLAGAGSGKTRVLTTRIAHLIQHHGVDPNRILSVTFTNKAAEEMRQRIARLLGNEPRGMWSGTFHAIGARILRAHAAAVGRTPAFTIYDADDTLAVTKRVMEASGVSPKSWAPKLVAALISDAKNALVSPEEYTSLALDPLARNTAAVYRNLEPALRAANAATFDDLLTLPVALLEQNPELRERFSHRFQFILVDEYQDTNRAQYRLIKLLGEGHGNVAVVGDDDQCLIAGTRVTMADRSARRIETIRAGDVIRSALGGGRFGPARVLRTATRVATDGIAITLRSGRRMVSTPEHTHFACSPAQPTPTPSRHPSRAADAPESRGTAVLTLCALVAGEQPAHELAVAGSGSFGRRRLEALGLTIESLDRSQWRCRSLHPSYRSAVATAERVAREMPLHVVQQARLGRALTGLAAADLLPFIPAASVRPGMLMLDGDGEIDVVIAVEAVPLDAPVYDIDVEGTHNFVAEGIVTHNSIYGWRGADIRNILDFEREFSGARVVRLEENYRSTPNILELANVAISSNVSRKGKTLRATRPAGERVTVVATLDDRDEAEWVVDEIVTRMSTENRSARDFAVLYRTNSQSRPIEDALRKRAMPYRLIGAVRFYDRREIRDLMAYLKLIANPADNEAFRRAVAVPKRGLGDTTIDSLSDAARSAGVPMLEAAGRPELLASLRPAARSGLAAFADMIRRFSDSARTSSVDELLRDLVDSLRYGDYLKADAPEQARDRIENVSALIDGAAETVVDEGGEIGLTPLDHFLQRAMLVAGADQLDSSADAVTLMTLHNAKGLEFPVVFITGLEDALFPTSQSFEDPAKMEEERRLFYVGITRAEEKLYITHAESRRRNGELVAGIKSRFIKDLPPELLEQRATVRARSVGRSTWGEGNRRRTYDVPAWRPTGNGRQRGWESESQDMPSYVKGERVKHATFGTGTIDEIGGTGRDVKATITFDDETVGRKTVKLAYTTLERE